MLHYINQIKRNRNRTQYSYLMYEFNNIQHKTFKFKYKNPLNPRDLIPVELDLPATGKKYSSDSNLSTVLTQLARYSKEKSVDLSPEWNAIKGNIQELFIKRFLKSPKTTKVTNDLILKHLVPVVQKFSRNGALFKELNLVLTDLSKTFSIRFFLKTIEKVVMAKSLDADKKGQGISAWSSELNSVYCALFRAIEECFQRDLKPNIIYDNGISETDLDARISQLWDHDSKIFTSDCKEFDANQDASTQFLEDCFIELYLPSNMFKIYRQMRLRSKQKSSYVTMMKEAVKDSGEPGTLLLNTVVKMSHTMLITDVVDVKMESYKGDDGCINAGGIRLCNKLFELSRSLHLPVIADMDYPLHGDMAGWFYSEFGIIPDILKIVAKFVCKDFNKKSTLTPWEKLRFGVNKLSYIEQVKVSLYDKRKFLNEKKLVYLRKIYLDLYGMGPGNFEQLMSYYYWLHSNDCTADKLQFYSSIYFADSGYERDDLTEADKNRKRIIQTHENVQDVKI